MEQKEEDQRLHKKWYGTNRWKRLRAAVLKRDPLCLICLNSTPKRFTPATVADHIEAREHFTPDEFFDYKGLQGICWECHQEKTVFQDLPKRKRQKATTPEFF